MINIIHSLTRPTILRKILKDYLISQQLYQNPFSKIKHISIDL